MMKRYEEGVEKPGKNSESTQREEDGRGIYVYSGHKRVSGNPSLEYRWVL